MARQDLVAELFYNSTWNAVDAYVDNPAQINRDRSAGSEPTPTSVTLTLAGIYNPKHPLSPLYGTAGLNTPIRLTLDSDVRFYGEIASFAPGRSLGYDGYGRGKAWTTIQASGILRRLGQGADPLRSAAYRAISGITSGDFVPHEYWPMEDPSSATAFASAVGGEPMVRGAFTFDGEPGLGPVSFASESTLLGSAPLPVFGPKCSMKGPIRPYADTGRWVYQIMLRLPLELDEQSFGLLDLRTANTNLPYVFISANSQTATTWRFRLRVYDASVSVTDDFSFDVVDTDVLDQWLSISVASVLNGSGSDDTVNLSVYDVTGNTLGTTGAQVVDANFHGAITFAEVISPTGMYPPTVFSIGGGAWGHAAIFVDPAFTVGTDDAFHAIAAGGHMGEQAHERIERLCDEEGIAITVEGSESQPMGPQPREALVDLFSEIERTDDGILFEPRDSYGLVYRTGRECCNRATVLALDYAAAQVAPPLEPVLDDLASRNDVTVQRSNGGSARAVLESGALSVLAPPDGIGRYTTQVDVNTDTDAALPNHAYWHLHKGTVDEIRYARVSVYLDQLSPTLATAAAAVDIGDVITIDNLPVDETLVQARLYVTGYTEHIESHRRILTFSCIPASTFDVGVYGTDAIVSRYDSEDSTLAAGYTSTDTSFSVTTTTGHALWTTGSSGPTFPFDINVSGIRIRVTAISGSSSPQTFTVTRSVDGYDKALSSGAQVRLWNPARYAL